MCTTDGTQSLWWKVGKIIVVVFGESLKNTKIAAIPALCVF